MVRFSIFLLLTLICHSLSASDRHSTVGLSAWSGYPQSVKGFKDALNEAGFVEGKNITYILGNSGGDKNKQKEIATQFKDSNVDLVYSLTTPGTVIVKEVLPSTTPIVFSIVTYPADSGLIESFEYSANNLVGTSNYVPLHNHVNLLKTLLPNAKKVAIFHRKGEPNSKIQTAGLTRSFKRKGIEVIDQAPSSLDEVKSMALSLVGKVDAFVTTTDTLMQGGGEDVLIEISKEKKIPILSSNKKGIENGSTFGPVADFYTLGKMSGEKAARILLHQTEPSRMESEYQDPPLTLLNRTSITLLGIEIPDSMLKTSEWVK